MPKIMRNSKGQFTTSSIPHNKNKKGYINNGSFKKGHILLSNSLNEWREKGGKVWNKGLKTKLNTGRTHFKKGNKPWNFKGGISSTKEYKLFYKSKYKIRKKGAIGNHSMEDWILLKSFFKYMCLCCKKIEPDIKLSEDHIIPLSLGGSDNIDNIQPLCTSCNSMKHTKVINYINLNNSYEQQK